MTTFLFYITLKTKYDQMDDPHLKGRHENGPLLHTCKVYCDIYVRTHSGCFTSRIQMMW